MNRLYIFLSLIHYRKQKTENGFTLIELAIVVLILGVLSAMLLPNTIKQAAKAREVEGKNNIGMIIRAQQTYHFETTTFATSLSTLFSNISIQGNYYTFPDPTVAHNTIVKHQVLATNPTTDQVRNYAGGVYFNGGAFAVAICQSANVNIAVDIPNVISDPCTNNGTRLK